MGRGSERDHQRVTTGADPTSCVVCGVRFVGRYRHNWWGDAYCDHHTTCDSCSRPMSDDRSFLCSTCRFESVTMRDEAVRAMLRVSAWMAGIGIGLSDVPLRFLDEPRPSQVPHPAHTLTQELTRTSPRGVRSVDRSITGVEVVRGLTRIHFSSLLAHELTHAWVFLEAVHLPAGMVEEGVSELVRSFWLRTRAEPEAAYWLEAMERSRDPVYGEGYRWVRARYRGEPLPDFVRSLAAPLR